jgi:hypothetical protein
MTESRPAQEAPDVGERIKEFIGGTAMAAMFAPVAIIEQGAKLGEAGTRVLRRFINPPNKLPTFPWHLSKEEIEERRATSGLSDEQIGHQARFERRQQAVKRSVKAGS